MGLIVIRKTTKSLAVWRKIWQILTVSCKNEKTLRNC